MQKFMNQMRKRSLLFTLALGISLTLLIWAKLRLVAGVPRQAYADPKVEQQASEPERPRKPAEVHASGEQIPAEKLGD